MYCPLKNIVHLFFREGDKAHGNKAFLRQYDIRQNDLVWLDRFHLDEKGEKGRVNESDISLS